MLTVSGWRAGLSHGALREESCEMFTSLSDDIEVEKPIYELDGYISIPVAVCASKPLQALTSILAMLNALICLCLHCF